MKKIRLKTDGRSLQAHRDENGVPHVHAVSWLDALYGLGYLHVLDRGTQMLFSRSVASGTASEDISAGDELLETDRFFRRVGLHRNLSDEVADLPSDSRKQLAAYCAGVNAGLRYCTRSLPMWATGFQPQPWDAEATLLIGKLLSFGGLAVSQMQNERLLLELIHAGVDDAALKELFAPRLDNVDFELLRKVHMSNQLSDDALELLTDLPRLAGSNAWAVSPSRSATGAPLLANDPHLEINRLPAIWYEVVLHWGDRWVLGATLPGCPLFAVARTDRVAWGVTYMKGDTVDFFVEECRKGPVEGEWEYRRDDDWYAFRRRDEIILRKGLDPVLLEVLENEQGTLEVTTDDIEEGYQLSLAWSGSHSGNGQAIGTWLDVVQAESAASAMDIVRECTQPTLCWVVADREGHIGLQGCGRIPIRGGDHLGLTPIPAWDRDNHWQGWLPTEKLPRIYDPECGFVATANEELNNHESGLIITQPLPGYRKRRIVHVLAANGSATVEDMQALQYDLVSTQAEQLLEVFLPHMPDGEVKERLMNWDFRYDPESHEATLFQRLYRNVIIELLGPQVVGWRRMLYLCTRAGYSTMILTVADRLLLKDESTWWRGRHKRDLIRAAVQRTEKEEDLPWSEVNYFHFTDRFFGNHQVGRMLGYQSRRVPMAGNHATPFQGHVLQTATRESTFAPSYHFVVDLSTNHAWTNLPGGPSEKRFSKYYRNDVQRWLTGEYKQLKPTPRS